MIVLALGQGAIRLGGADAPAAGHLHWQPLLEPGCGGAITALAISPHDGRRILVGGDMLGIGVSEDRGEHWQSAFDLPSYEIADFTFHPSDPLLIWVGTMSGPCVSVDGGHHWSWKRAGMPAVSWSSYSAPIQKILFDPRSAHHLFAFGGSRRRWRSPDGSTVWAVWESRDDGNHWQEISRIDGNADVAAAAITSGDSPVIYVALQGKGVWASQDDGRSWEPRNRGLSDLSASALSVHPADPRRLWVSIGNPHGEFRGNGGLFTSVDGGGQWSRVEKPGNDGSAVMLCSSSPGTLYACDFSWQGGTTFISADSGASWTATLANPTFTRAYRAGAQMGVLAVDPGDPHVAFVGNTETIARTTDGGRSWSDATSISGPDGRWSGRGYSGLCAQAFTFDPYCPGHAILIAMDNGNLWQSDDDLTTWRWGGGERFPGWGFVRDLAFADRTGQSMFLALEQCDLGVVARTADGGRHWHACGNLGLSHETVIAIHASPSAPGHVWIADRKGALSHSSDSGAHWTLTLPAGITVLCACPGSPLGLLAGGRDGVLRCLDGEHFQPIPGGPREVVNLAAGGGDACHILAATSHELWCHADGRWNRVRSQDQLGQVVVDPADAQRIAYACADDPYHDQTRASGVWISSDGGSSWSQQIDGLPMLRGRVLALDPHDPQRLVFGTNGRGYFTARWPRR
jgi:photosystem II stability/assembly factor-like uncharacterized protein